MNVHSGNVFRSSTPAAACAHNRLDVACSGKETEKSVSAYIRSATKKREALIDKKNFRSAKSASGGELPAVQMMSPPAASRLISTV
ncbi:MAG: hypothetical protein IPN64_06205 [Propionivibrio sp.]|nr:hypothetical protein [Propionivibrio sp.]